MVPNTISMNFKLYIYLSYENYAEIVHMQIIIDQML